MIDFLKAISENQIFVNRLYDYALKNLQSHKPQNNYYVCFSSGSGRFRFEFRKVIIKGELIGFRNVEVCFCPHYIFNNNLHNGNDFTALNCIKVIRETFLKIGIIENELIYFKVANLEYGLNLLPHIKIESLIDGLIFYNNKPFILGESKHPYSKISKTTDYKKIKGYAKGLQLTDYDIDRNTFRFEVRSKECKFIRKNLLIENVSDLLELEKYGELCKSIIKEFYNLLILNLEPNFSLLSTEDEAFIRQSNNVAYWNDLAKEPTRKKFNRHRLKYDNIMKGENDIMSQIFDLIIEKIRKILKH